MPLGAASDRVIEPRLEGNSPKESIGTVFNVSLHPGHFNSQENPKFMCNLLWNLSQQVSFGEGSKEKLTQTRREEGVVAMRNTKNTIIPSNPMEPEPEPPHKGHTNIIPYNTPKAEENQASGGQQIPVQEQAATPQPINEGAFHSTVVPSGFVTLCSRWMAEELRKYISEMQTVDHANVKGCSLGTCGMLTEWV